MEAIREQQQSWHTHAVEVQNCRRETGNQIGKTKNQMLKKGKTAHRNRHQNRKTEVFRCKNRNTDLKNGQNRKSQHPPPGANFWSLGQRFLFW